MGYPEEPAQEAEPRPDPYADQCAESLIAFFRQHRDEVFYMKQLEVLWEKRYYHWITARALSFLEGGELRTVTKKVREGIQPKFFFHRRNRYYRRAVDKAARIIEQYSEPVISRAIGSHAENLFLLALLERGAEHRSRNSSEYGTKKWAASDHDMDFISEIDSLPYGFEVKNTWDYIEREEMRIKVDLCKYLGITPVFIVRASPKTYIEQVRQAGGFTLVFEAQIYELGMQELAKEVRDGLHMPVVASATIPDGIIQRFLKWHRRRTQVVDH